MVYVNLKMNSINYEEFTIIDKEYLKKKNLYGKDPLERDFSEVLDKGVIILDKPSDVTSQDLVIHIKRALNINKASHVGTLDPKVTGILPILLNRAVKLNHYLSKQDKEYVVLMNIHKEMEEDKIISILKGFEGEINQLPPRKSAVKRKVRKRKIYAIEILEIDSNRYVLFKAKVQAGTYIRALCRDFGRISGVGAHMQELRRTESLGFNEKEAINFYDFYERAYLYSTFNKYEPLRDIIIPVEEVIFRNFKPVYVKDEAASSIVYGAKLFPRGIIMHHNRIKKGEIVGVFTLKKELIGLMKTTIDFNNLNFSSKKPVAIPERIFITPKEMPRLWKK